uniref:Uncharacterized protein n=1 Tax=Picea glauca TaxID=3330 RepID=A0A101M0L5_PICGL|nr:hypothetical protein ABT39_MTgene4165 [Picea glauca]
MKEICNSDFHDPSLNERDHSGMNYICNYAFIHYICNYALCSMQGNFLLVRTGQGCAFLINSFI